MTKVPLVLDRVAQFARRQGHWDSDCLLLVVRELVVNAIVHGNESVSTKLALVRIARRRRYFEVQVEDEGEGFDYESLVLGLPDDPQNLKKRGLVIVHELSSELSFERGGCRVRAIVEIDSQDSDLARGAYGARDRKAAGRYHVQAQW